MMSTIRPLTSPIELLFGDGKSFKIIVDAIVSPIEESPRYVGYPVRYQANDLGITADIASEAFGIDFQSLRQALQEILNEFRPGSNRAVDFLYGVLYVALETTSTGWIDLLVSLTPEPVTATEFSFHFQLQQEEVKRLIRDIDELLSGQLVGGNL